MRPVAVAGERLGIDFVALLFEDVGDAPPAPAAAAPMAMRRVIAWSDIFVLPCCLLRAS
jgi:hypothetical protein